MPSLPANGESFTENVISTVGSEIFTKGNASKEPKVQIVSPIVMFSIPLIQTISPAVAISHGTLLSPSI